jgi:hypothetical protein
MISHEEFGKLRLVQYLPDTNLARLRNWEFEERYWVGEGFGFSQWLRLESDPHVLRALSIAFDDFPPDAAADVLKTIGLPLIPGMTLPAIQKVLGEPVKKYHFGDDRVSYDFTSAGPTYHISCTILNNGGLSYLEVMQPLPPERIGTLGRIVGRFWEIMTRER